MIVQVAHVILSFLLLCLVFVISVVSGFLPWVVNGLRRRYARIKVDAKCPGCGNRKGQLRMVYGEQAEGERKKMTWIEHTCKICVTTVWYEPTVVDGKNWFIPPEERPRPNSLIP